MTRQEQRKDFQKVVKKMNNCFMYRPEKNDCSALKKIHTDCGTEMCPFYKTEAEQKAQTEKARGRCKKLGIPYGDDYARVKKNG